MPKLLFKFSRQWHEMYSVILFVSSCSLFSLLVEVEHCQNWFSNFPANGMRCILLYIICFLMQFIQFAGGGLTLPKLVFAEIFPLIA